MLAKIVKPLPTHLRAPLALTLTFFFYLKGLLYPGLWSETHQIRLQRDCHLVQPIILQHSRKMALNLNAGVIAGQIQKQFKNQDFLLLVVIFPIVNLTSELRTLSFAFVLMLCLREKCKEMRL